MLYLVQVFDKTKLQGVSLRKKEVILCTNQTGKWTWFSRFMLRKATDSSHEFSGTVLVDGNKCGQLIIHNISGVVYNFGDEPYGDESFDSLACVASDPELLDTCLYKLSNNDYNHV